MKNIINFLLMLLALVSFSCNDRLPGGLIGEWDSEQMSKIEGHDAVDLGLPSGTWWSTCNLGATSPSLEGHYFEYKWTKDSTMSPNVDLSGDSLYDNARIIYGGYWRTPTKKDVEELINNCKWSLVQQSSVSGYLVTGTNGKSIFLPAPGFADGTQPTIGYWTSTPYDNLAFRMELRISGVALGTVARSLSYFIRPVRSADFYFDFSYDKYTYKSSASEVRFSISSNISWYAECEASWVTWEKNGNDVVIIKVDANTTKSMRTARVLFRSGVTGEVLHAFEVEQIAGVLNIEQNTINVNASGGEYMVLLTTTVNYRVESSAEWITVLSSDSLGVSFSVKKNENTVERTGHLIFWGENDEQMGKVAVVQAGANQSGGGLEGDSTDTREYVDLGLPSGLKWATCNVGAAKPEDYGGYYAWGETDEKDDYSWSTYKWCNGTFDSMTKYCTIAGYGTVDNKTVLEPEDDVAHVKWGGEWRMPTEAEQDELCDNCTWTWTTLNGVNGYQVTGPNGNSIFLPAAGYSYGTGVHARGYCGYYWSSSLSSSNNNYACYLYFDVSFYDWNYNDRFYGQSVRPVISGIAAGEYFTLETKSLELSYSEGEYNINVNTNIAWSATASNLYWINVTKVDNTKLKISLTENTATEARTATITFKRSDNDSVLGTVTVTQAGEDNEGVDVEVDGFGDDKEW